jgi:glycosyltransferase involved in cell wall biosynthesis
VKIAIAMPAYNEADALPNFLGEIKTAFSKHELTIFIVDDCSLDNTIEVASKFTEWVEKNNQNSGHGPTYLRALSRASENTDFDVVLATDGDGQCSAQDLLRLAMSVENGSEIAIGKRISRDEPLYRRLVSKTVNLMVFLKTGRFFPDSNSPHRAFSKTGIRNYNGFFTGKESIPNIIGTLEILRNKLPYEIVAVTFRDRTADTKHGTTWGQISWRQIPTRRFLEFCLMAAKEFLSR